MVTAVTTGIHPSLGQSSKHSFLFLFNTQLYFPATITITSLEHSGTSKLLPLQSDLTKTGVKTKNSISRDANFTCQSLDAFLNINNDK